MQVDLTTSHNSVLHGAICFCARIFCDIPRNEAVFKLKLIPSPEKMWSRRQHPPPWTEQCLTLPWQPPVPLPSVGTVRDTSANTWRHSDKRTPQTYFVMCSQTNHFAGEATEQLWFSSALPWLWSSFQVRAMCPLWSWSLLHARIATSDSKSLGSKLFTDPPQLSPAALQTGWSVNSEKLENCSGTDMRTKGMVSNLGIKKYAKINCGKHIKFLRNNILTTTFQENFSKINICSDTFSHPSDSQVGSQKMWLALFH